MQSRSIASLPCYHITHPSYTGYADPLYTYSPFPTFPDRLTVHLSRTEDLVQIVMELCLRRPLDIIARVLFDLFDFMGP